MTVLPARINELRETQVTLPHISFYEGHDVSVTVWDPARDLVIVYPLERVSGIKHYAVHASAKRKVFVNRFVKPGQFLDQQKPGSKRLQPINRRRLNDFIGGILKNLKKDFGIENNFECFNYKPTFFQQSPFMATPFNFDVDQIKAKYIRLATMNHHEGHAWAAYMQCPWNKCTVMTWDSGGDNTTFMFSEFENAFVNSRLELPNIRFSTVWDQITLHFGSTKETPNVLDLAGKIMGLSAYGKEHAHLAEEYIPQILHWCLDFDNTQFDWKNILRKEINDWIDEKFTTGPLLGKPETIVAYALQQATERGIVKVIEERFIDTIRKNDSRLAIAGGTGMNILANEAIKNAFPDIQVYVPSNPADDNISFGMLAWETYYSKKMNEQVRTGKFSCLYAGPYLFDHETFGTFLKKRPDAREITLLEMADLLRQGRIIGFVHGRTEVGPRALGNRSILCDASIPGMKDTLNMKVKKRESFRPFAPACKLEDAPKYFESRDFELMDAMQFAVKVKDEYKEKLSEITHVDGTARVQTVTKESNPVFYELLEHFDGVLLNTSFNVQGKPILNTLKEAFYILDNTQLDNLVVQDKESERFFLF